MDNSKIITLVSSDGDKLQISEKAASRSQLLKGMIDLYQDDPEIPLKVKSHILQKIIAYLEYYKDAEPKEIEKPLPSNNFNECVEAWDYQFIDLELDLIFEIILAANYMDIKPLMELASSKVASIIKGKSPEEIRKTFNIQNDFTPEEEAQIREENQWCMENL
jgi:S-phase kinase-associated protein 1